MAECLLLTTLLSAQSVFSTNNKYQGIIEYANTINLTTVSFTLVNASGETLYTKSNPEAITFFVTNAGTVFATTEKRLFFYDSSGKDTLLKDLNYPNGFGFSPDNARFFASDKNDLVAYCPCGRLKLRLKPARLFASTARAKIVVAVSNDTLIIYRDGKEKHTLTLATPYIHNVAFSDDGRYVILKEPSGRERFEVYSGKKMEDK
jgi:DNA-binding beta-propeller fold protein YncE